MASLTWFYLGIPPWRSAFQVLLFTGPDWLFFMPTMFFTTAGPASTLLVTAPLNPSHPVSRPMSALLSLAGLYTE